MRFHLPRFILPVATAVAALIPITAMASGLTVSIGTPTLTNRTLITLPVTVSCPAIDPTVADFIFGEQVNASVQQPVGQSFATASGGVGGSQNNLVFSCDGTSKTVTLSMLANPTGPPFHGGPAIISASVAVQAGFEAFPGCGCGFVTLFESATAGPQSVTLH